MLSHTKQIGSAGEMIVISDLLRQGWHVFTDVSDCSYVDLIAMKENRLVRLQVKTNSDTLEAGTLCARFGKVTNRRVMKYPVGSFDVLALCALDRKRVAYISFTPEMYGAAVTLRFEPPKNQQQKRIRLFQDHEILT